MPAYPTLLASLNKLHRAALGTEDWSEALSGLGAVLDVEAVSLEEFSFLRGSHKVYGYSAFEQATIAEYVAHFHTINPRWQAALACKIGNAIADDLVASRTARHRSEFFNWIEQASEFTYCMGLKLHHDKETLAALALHRSDPTRGFEPGTQELVERIAPNLMTIYETAREIEVLRERNSTGLSLFDSVRMGVGLISSSGKISDMNRSLRRLIAASALLSVDANGQLVASPSSLAAKIALAITGAFSGTSQVVKFTDPAAGSTTLRLVPPGVNDGGMGHRREVLLIARGDFAERVAVGEVCAAFGLGEREAEVALEVLQGHSLEQIAAALKISPGTVRVHLRNIFSKTNTHRQGELAAMLSNALVP